VLPRHYTELLIRLEREVKGSERYALRDWLDLFNHRLVSLFFRAWEKYRFYIPFERGEYALREPDAFTRCLLSLVGLGMPTLRDRLRVACLPASESRGEPRVLGCVDDLALLRFGGFLSHRPRPAVSLEALLQTYLQLPVQVQQFQGQWLQLDPASQTSLGGQNLGAMGRNVVVGDRIWDVQGRIRIRLGPLGYQRFAEFLPDRSPVPERKGIYLIAHLVRLYVGPEVDVEFQLILRAEDVPQCQLGEAPGMGARLGWNTWSRGLPAARHADEAVFEAEELVWVS
jgi:type VI secretion system protein ImpH